MKIIVYLKNSYNDYITISTIDEFKLDSSKNINYELLTIIRNSLKEQNLKLSQYRCINKIKNTYYFIVKVNTTSCDISLTGFNNIKYSNKSNLAKPLGKYKNKINNSKLIAIKDAFLSKFTTKDLILFLMEFVILGLSLLIKYTEKSNGASFLLVGSIVLILLSTLEKIAKSIFEANTFKKMCNYSTSFNYSSEYDNTKEIKETVLKNYKLSKNYEKFTHIDLNNNESFVYSHEENHNFKKYAKTNKVKFVKISNSLNKDSRTALAHIIGSKLNDDKTIFNGKLLGINSELCFKQNQEVEIKNVRYHNYVSIDEMIYRNIFTPYNASNALVGKNICLNPLTKSFMDIKNSHLTNLIGVNLLVELHCNNKIYYLVNDQSLYNDVNQERLVPTSSGSLDQADFKKFKTFDHKDQNFSNLLLIGMLRELYEESYLYFNLINGNIVKSKENKLDLEVVNFDLLGFGRLTSKAGKPDFFGKLTLKSNNTNIINDILNNYNDYQNKFLGTKNQLETIKLRIIEKDELFIHSNNYSPQLQYSVYLIKNEE